MRVKEVCEFKKKIKRMLVVIVARFKIVKLMRRRVAIHPSSTRSIVRILFK